VVGVLVRGTLSVCLFSDEGFGFRAVWTVLLEV
jgi:hypothetical protein